MVPSQSRLAEVLNALVAQGRVAVSETRTRIAVNQLVGPEADRVASLLDNAGWSDLEIADEGGSIEREQVADSGSGIRITATPPEIPAGIDAVVTSAGFASLLERPAAASVVWVEGLQWVIDTCAVRYCPWDSTGDFTPLDASPNPAKVVRLLGRDVSVNDLGRWLLREPALSVAGAAAFPWRVRAASWLLRALAQEIEPDGKLLFRGPPSARFFVTDREEMAPSYFAAVQSVTGWVYESDRELENRHGLLAAEIARTSIRDGGEQDLACILSPALEGARIAYNFGITQQSRDTLRSLGDLRKTVSDDAAKLSDTTRTLAVAVIGAVFGNISLIVARVTLPEKSTFVGQAALLLGVIITIYVLATVGIGCHYISVQRGLRREWKSRLYRFLSDDDYSRLVDKPVRRAEVAFWISSIVGIVLAVLLLFAVYTIAAAP